MAGSCGWVPNFNPSYNIFRTTEITTHILLLLLCCLTPSSYAWGGDKVLLSDVQVLTLRQGQYTTGRRSSPVPQLTCVGGTAGCHAFIPQVVQCYNRGSDGSDIQWECKSDMDNAFRFGKVEVTCEGYNYPDDPYILKGSCGLEYTIDLTKEGLNQQQGQYSHNYYGSQSEYGWNPNVLPTARKNQFFTNMACLAVFAIIVYAIYKTCIAPGEHGYQRSTTNQDYPPDSRGPGTSPPPPGFRPGYNSGSGDGFFNDDSCSGSYSRRSRGGGFWTGAATGGLLGYLFGARNNNTGYHDSTYNMGMGPRPSTSYGFRRPTTSFGAGPSTSSGFFSGSSGSSSGTRTASGFGSTRRR